MDPEFKKWLTEQKYYRVIVPRDREYWWVVCPFFKSYKEWTWERMVGKIKLGVTSR